MRGPSTSVVGPRVDLQQPVQSLVQPRRPPVGLAFRAVAIEQARRKLRLRLR